MAPMVTHLLPASFRASDRLPPWYSTENAEKASCAPPPAPPVYSGSFVDRACTRPSFTVAENDPLSLPGWQKVFPRCTYPALIRTSSTATTALNASISESLLAPTAERVMARLFSAAVAFRCFASARSNAIRSRSDWMASPHAAIGSNGAPSSTWKP